MNALIWNIRSVNIKKAFKRLLSMHTKHIFFLIGLMEPFQQAYKLDSYRRRLGLETALCSVSGKIWAFVDAEYEVNVLVDSVQQMTLKLSNSNNSTEMIVTLVHAKCDRIERRELWESLYHLASDKTLPWLVGGDFNVIIDEEEKYGGLPVTLNEVEDFRHCIQSCNLSDLGYEEITHLIKFGSDHLPLLLECKQQVQQFKKSFKFLNFWTKHDTFLDVVKYNWETDVLANSFMTFNVKLKKMKKVLSTWSKSTYGDIFQKITNLEDVIKAHEAIFEANPSYANREKLMKGRRKSLQQTVQEFGLIRRMKLQKKQSDFIRHNFIKLMFLHTMPLRKKKVSRILGTVGEGPSQVPPAELEHSEAQSATPLHATSTPSVAEEQDRAPVPPAP
ncbi:uncharacterized protein LOC132048800 [Lycium ferocissimum]|uniref:uncharacterized protein LOC132048800 n=1 Tax=Lycium ferocissimum TaxID=112874 RepID=UPI0028169298|nr:uncharacterized protein LOC132048800 [Lycium ferocissimum]